jgi:hypothetical protein
LVAAILIPVLMPSWAGGSVFVIYPQGVGLRWISAQDMVVFHSTVSPQGE